MKVYQSIVSFILIIFLFMVFSLTGYAKETDNNNSSSNSTDSLGKTKGDLKK